MMTIILPGIVAIERMIIIGFPYRHRSIMTTKTVIGILATVLGISVILSVTSTIVVPADVVWPLALVYFNTYVRLLIILFRLTSAVFITIVNIFLYYQVWVSNRKAKENERLGNEEEAKKFQKLIQLLRMQMKSTITLLLVGGIVGGIDVIEMFSSHLCLA